MEVNAIAASQDKNTAEGFLGSVFKYSVSTFVNMGIMGLSMLLIGLFVAPEHSGQMSIFTSSTTTVMNIAILGLDQSLIRFYFEPPGKLSPSGLFRTCFYFSTAVLLVGGALCSTVLLGPAYAALGISTAGPWVVPALFLNVLFYMVARYFNVLYRMEGNILVYTVESILMQFFFRLFYLLGAFFGHENPVPAMVVCSVAGLGGFALVFSFLRRRVLRPRAAEFKSGVYRHTLPYGIVIAPTTVIVSGNYSVALILITHLLGGTAAGFYGYGYMLSNIVSTVQLGFASFWGPYMFENYKTQQPRIKRVHNYLNFVILSFFALLVAFEDIIFLILPAYAGAMPVFPLMMLSAVFTILCETTVYGNAIARRPIFDTLGFALSFAVNIGLCLALCPGFGLYGAAVAIAVGNFVMFLFRSFTAQRLYQSIENPLQTAVAVALAVALAAAGTALTGSFLARLAASLVTIGLYCLLYRGQLRRLWGLALSILGGLFKRGKK